MVYDHFIGDPNCIHMVVFKLSDPQDVQLSQVLFWLNFIKARVPPTEPVGKILVLYTVIIYNICSSVVSLLY